MSYGINNHVVTKHGFMFNLEGYNYRLTAYLKPHTSRGNGWSACCIYVGQWAEGQVIGRKTQLGAPLQIYRNRNDVLSSSSPAIPALVTFLHEYFNLTIGQPIPEEDWKDALLLINGTACETLLEEMGAFELRSAYANAVGGVTGGVYPSSDDIRRKMVTIRNVEFRSLTNVLPVLTVNAALATIDNIPVFNKEGCYVNPVGPHRAAAVAAVAAAKAMSPTSVAIAEAAAAIAVFDPEGMTHRDLVLWAEKGHRSVDTVADLEGQINSLTDLLDVEQKAVKESVHRVIEAQAKTAEAERRAEMVAPVKTSVVTGDGTVEIGGVTLPSFEGGHGPTPIAGYDLAAWQAVLEVGDFKATASAPQVAAAIMGGDSVRLVGPPSVGKTSGIREVCAHTGAKFFLIPCGEGATDLSLIAERVIGNGGEFVWRDGHVTQSVRWAIANPETVCISVLDEVDHLLPEVQSLMHSVLEGSTLVVSPEETLAVPANIRFVATANTSGLGDITGHHASAKVSDTAFTSRWNATYTVAYLPPDAEARLLVGAGAPAQQAEQAVRCANMTRTDGASVTQPIVLRQLLAWARACGRGESPREAWAWRIMTSTPEHDRGALRELTRTCLDW